MTTDSREGRVSVIIAVLDGEKYLAEAIASAEIQGDGLLEILVVDDGSRDGSLALAEGWGGKVRCLAQEHGGIASARNRGIREAGGELLCFLDADDYWMPNSLAPRVAVFDSDEATDIVIAQVEQFVSDDVPRELAGRLKVPTGWSAGFLAGAMVLRRSLFDRFGLLDESLRSGEFIDWFSRVRDGQAVLRTLDVPTLRRRVHAVNHGRLHRDGVRDYLRVVRSALARRRSGGS